MGPRNDSAVSLLTRSHLNDKVTMEAPLQTLHLQKKGLEAALPESTRKEIENARNL